MVALKLTVQFANICYIQITLSRTSWRDGVSPGLSLGVLLPVCNLGVLLPDCSLGVSSLGVYYAQIT